MMPIDKTDYGNPKMIFLKGAQTLRDSNLDENTNQM